MKDKIYAFDIEENLEYFAIGFDGGINNIRVKPIGTLSKIEEEKLEKQKKEQAEEDEDEQIKLLDPSKYSEKPVIKNYRYFFRGQYNKTMDSYKEYESEIESYENYLIKKELGLIKEECTPEDKLKVSSGGNKSPHNKTNNTKITEIIT